MPKRCHRTIIVALETPPLEQSTASSSFSFDGASCFAPNARARFRVGLRLNPAAWARAAGQFGTLDAQRVGTPSSFVFYSGYTAVSNMNAGIYLFGAGLNPFEADIVSMLKRFYLFQFRRPSSGNGSELRLSIGRHKS